MTKRKRDRLNAVTEEVAPGLTEQGGIVIARAPGGAAFFRPAVPPRSWHRLNGDGQDAVAHLQTLAAQIHEMQGHLELHVQDARDLGISWDLIGWSIGTTGEAARQRFGIPDDDE